jgi:N-acetylmuramoyl-L-alanine amidase
MKSILKYGSLALVFITLVSFINKNYDDTLPNGKTAIKTIIIDPGHGGIDPGARGTFSTEAQVSLAVSLKLGKAIQKEFPEMKIIYTRTTDVMAGNKPNKDAGLRYRADLANSSGADLFISVHCNSAGKKAGGWYEKVVVDKIANTKYVGKGKNRKKKTFYTYKYENVYRENKARGTETYIWATSKNDDKLKSLTQNNEFYGEIDSTSSVQLPDPSDPVEMARMLVYANNYFHKSLSLADFIEKEFAAIGRVSRGVKQRNDKGIWVLQATGMPSVLIEIGFISNTEEEKYINSDQGQQEIVNNVISALKSYKARLEARNKALEEDKKAF